MRKRQTRWTGFDDKILSIYARGMTMREVQGHLEEIYGPGGTIRYGWKIPATLEHPPRSATSGTAHRCGPGGQHGLSVTTGINRCPKPWGVYLISAYQRPGRALRLHYCPVGGCIIAIRGGSGVGRPTRDLCGLNHQPCYFRSSAGRWMLRPFDGLNRHTSIPTLLFITS